MSGTSSLMADRYWVLGGRWADDTQRLPWPRVYGPFRDYQAARASAEQLNGTSGAPVRYLVVADVAEGAA